MLISSNLDMDLYQMTMQRYIHFYYPDAYASMKFINRGDAKLDDNLKFLLLDEIDHLKTLLYNSSELNYLYSLSELDRKTVDYCIRSRISNPLKITFPKDGFDFTIEGRFADLVLYETPLLSIISELYFDTIQTSWKKDWQNHVDQQLGSHLSKSNIVEMGTRRRRSRYLQEFMIGKFFRQLAGTSNLLLAKNYGIKPVGTCSHAIFMMEAALGGLEDVNYRTCKKWFQLFGEPLMSLSDTFTTDKFLAEYHRYPTMKNYIKGVRQDSGSPLVIAKKISDAGIRNIMFSDSLTVGQAKKLNDTVSQDFDNVSFGIGTNLTNPHYASHEPPLNIVIKLDRINGLPTCKISDDPGKSSGDNIEEVKRELDNERRNG